MSDLLSIVMASAADELHRLVELGNQGTAGPDADAHPIVFESHPPAPRWLNGWWMGARAQPVHPGRVGPPIRSCCTVVHTTDMLPEEWPALLKRWEVDAGDGACAHFGIGRDELAGVVQWVPITRNGNHAGGPGHGVLRTSTATYHPNTLAVGIEIHCAGGVHQVNGQWRLVENNVAHGVALPDVDVIPDPQRPGRGWHVVTDYQRAQLSALLADLELVHAPMPAGVVAVSMGEPVPSWGLMRSPRILGHVSLDPTHRSDPWPAQMQYLRDLR